MQTIKRTRRFNRRLERLVCSGLVPPKEQEEYAAELKKLAADVAEPDLIGRQARLLKALADETRLKMLMFLRLREMCVCELTVALDLIDRSLDAMSREIWLEDKSAFPQKHAKLGRSNSST